MEVSDPVMDTLLCHSKLIVAYYCRLSSFQVLKKLYITSYTLDLLPFIMKKSLSAQALGCHASKEYLKDEYGIRFSSAYIKRLKFLNVFGSFLTWLVNIYNQVNVPKVWNDLWTLIFQSEKRNPTSSKCLQSVQHLFISKLT